jgi:hypothetical protein
MVQDTRREGCFAWKQVELGFPSLALRLTEAGRGWCMWHHHEGRVEIKSKMNGSMQRVASNSSTLNFVIFFVLGHKGSLAISFPINRTPMADGEASNSAITLPPLDLGLYFAKV